jgi:hypothetical protein
MPPRTRNGRAKLESWKRWYSTEHYKYPETVGNDTRTDNISFNSHDSSEYAIERMDNISEATREPFMLFEFMTIDEDKAQAKIKAGSQQIKNTASAIKNLTSRTISEPVEVINDAREKFIHGMNNRGISKEELAGGWTKVKNKISGFITDASTPAARNYTGSIALYMPTDIQINDSMVYNEDTRKLGAALNSFASGEDGELVNWVTATDPAVLAAAGGAAGIIPGVPAALTAVITGSIGTLVQTEMQRHTGKVMNPNELARYSQTALRTFTFNWTMLPDNEYESDQAAGLIKFFRKSAHAKRTSSTLVTVPDHVVTSFHGAKDMIQLPPCFIESVNVTYNPNNSSFFKRNNAPVEIGLGVTMKEIVPIYAADVDKGY